MRTCLIMVVLLQITSVSSSAMRRSSGEGFRSPRTSFKTDRMAELRRLASSEIILDPTDIDNNAKPIVRSAPGHLEQALSPRQDDAVSLESLNMWIESPEQLGRFLEMHPELCLHIFLRLLEKMPVCEILQRQYALELRNARGRGLSTEVFRSETAATLLTMEILRNPGELQKFRDGFLDFAISSVDAFYRAEDPKSLACLAGNCCGYLTNLADNKIPSELVVILSSLSAAVQSACSETPVNVLLGSMFFLRFLCPALALPNRPHALPLATKTALMQLAKLLQLVSNQIEPDEKHCFFVIRNDLQDLYQPIGDFLRRIAALPPRVFTFHTH